MKSLLYAPQQTPSQIKSCDVILYQLKTNNILKTARNFNLQTNDAVIHIINAIIEN